MQVEQANLIGTRYLNFACALGLVAECALGLVAECAREQRYLAYKQPKRTQWSELLS